MNIAIQAEADQIGIAKKIAAQFDIPLLDENATHSFDFVLYYSQGQLQLQIKKEKPYLLNLIDVQRSHRYQHASLKKELLARAIGIKPQARPIILDATAGFGRDSFLLAALGYDIIALEKSPPVFLLLQDALERAKTDLHYAQIVNRLQLFYCDALSWLNCPTRLLPDVIYLDPMFPERRKKAAVKKDLVILQHLVEGEVSEPSLLLDLALSCAKKRVVVKRPRLAPTLSSRAPDFKMSGNCVRFDIYLTHV